MKTDLKLILSILLLPLAVSAQRTVTNSQTITVSGASIAISNPLSSESASFTATVFGFPTSTTVIINGCTAGNSCSQLDSKTITGNGTAVRTPSIGSIYDHFTVSATWTGGSGVFVTISTTITGATQGYPVPFNSAGYTDVTEISTPSPPAAGSERIYGKAGSGFCAQNSGGTEKCTGSGAAQVYPAAGVAVSTGSAWGTPLTAPSGTLVGTTDTQSLTNKTVDGVTPTTMGYLDATSSIQTQLNGKPHTFTASLDGGGSTLSTGAVYHYSPKVITGGTITDVSLAASNAGSTCSISIDVWKANAAIPTSGNKISGSTGPSVTSGNLAQSVSTSGWSSTTVSAGDVFAVNVASVTGCVTADLVITWY